MTYLDTSALIKRFVSEEGSGVVGRLIAAGRPIASATIAYAELYSGVTRRHREGDLSRLQYRLVCRHIETDWMAMVKVELGPEVLASARTLIERHALRGFDAIHLASALGLQGALNGKVTFVASDRRLLQAAGRERLMTVDPEAEP